MLARALAQEAPVLLLDEPTTALDLGRQQLVLELVDSLRGDGLTVVSTMHDLTLAGQFADRLLLLDRGAVVAEGTAAEVLSAPNVAAHYGANVRVVEDDGSVLRPPRPALKPVPLARAEWPPATRRRRGSRSPTAAGAERALDADAATGAALRRAQLEVALPWACEALDLEPPGRIR